MAAVRPAGPEPMIRSFVSVRPSPPPVKPGPPGTVVGAGESYAMSGRGAGALGAATPVSPEKSIARPPNGDAAGPPLPFPSALWESAGMRTDVPAPSAPGCCLLIDANIPLPPYPRGVSGRSSRVPQLGNQRRAQELELVRLVHVPDAEQHVLRAGIAELAEALDVLLRCVR